MEKRKVTKTCKITRNMINPTTTAMRKEAVGLTTPAQSAVAAAAHRMVGTLINILSWPCINRYTLKKKRLIV